MEERRIMADDGKDVERSKAAGADVDSPGLGIGADANAPARTIGNGGVETLGLRELMLLAALLAAGFVLDFALGKAISATTGGLIAPEFVISAFCLEILIVRPNLPQALVIGLVSAAVIQLTTTSPFLDFPAEGIAAVLMAVMVGSATSGREIRPFVPAVGTFVTTVVSGLVFMLIKMAMIGISSGIVGAMLPVILLTGAFNAVLVAALYRPVRKAVDLRK